MRDTIRLGPKGLIAIASCIFAIAACRPTPSPPSDASSQAQPPETDPSVITLSPPLPQDSSPQSSPEPGVQSSPEPSVQSIDSLPTLPTVPIESLPNSSSSKTIANALDSGSAISESSLSAEPEGETETQNAKAILTKGTSVSGKSTTQGEIFVVDDEGTPVIQFGQDFQTAEGPDLVVVLHRSTDPLADSQPPTYGLKEEEYVEIAPLKANQGKQHYSVPAAIILDNYNSVAIWCRTFNATFGAASLQ